MQQRQDTFRGTAKKGAPQSKQAIQEDPKQKLKRISKELLNDEIHNEKVIRNTFKLFNTTSGQNQQLNTIAKELMTKSQPNVYKQTNKLKTKYNPTFDFQEQAIKDRQERYFQGHLDEFVEDHLGNNSLDSLYKIKTNAYVLKQRPQLYTLSEAIK